MLGCCGAPAYWAGREDLFRESIGTLHDEWQRLGMPRVITACSTCQSLFKDHLPEMETVSIWQMVAETGLPLESCAASGTTLAIADPCITCHDKGTQEVVRNIVQSLRVAVEELSSSGDTPECCGYGGLMFNANPKLARDVVARRIDRENSTVNNYDYLAYCAMCRDHLAAAGKRVSHLIEQLFPNVGGGDPAARGWISWSERRSNRARVKQEILRERGERGEGMMAADEAMALDMTVEVRRRIDERRILDDDIRVVIHHAEQSGQRLKNNQADRYRACYQAENVTFWVDYTPQDGRFMIHNAYSHRMKIVGVKK